jgi:hypothetical protein
MSDTHAAENAASEAAVAQAQAGADPEIEARARRMGWKPKEEYKGPAERWTPPDEFVEKGMSEYPILLDRYKVLDDRAAQTERALREAQGKIGEQTEVLRELAEHNKKAVEAAYSRGKREIEARMEVAVAHADTDGFKRAQIELAQLEQTKTETVAKPATEARQQQTQQPAVDPVVERWVADNSWFRADPEAGAFAESVHVRLRATKPGQSMADNLAEVRTVVAKRFPEHFENPARSQAASVATPGAAPSPKPKNPKSYESLPPDAKKACDRFIKQIPGYTREQYCSTYDWS